MNEVHYMWERVPASPFLIGPKFASPTAAQEWRRERMDDPKTPPVTVTAMESWTLCRVSIHNVDLGPTLADIQAGLDELIRNEKNQGPLTLAKRGVELHARMTTIDKKGLNKRQREQMEGITDELLEKIFMAKGVNEEVQAVVEEVRTTGDRH